MAEPTGRRPGSSNGVQSVDRAVELLEVIAAGDGHAGLSELAHRSGLPTPTVHRLIQTLMHRGLVWQAADRRYRLGPRLIHLGEAATVHLSAQAQPFLDEIRDTLGETTNFAVLQGGEIVYLGQAASRHSMRMFTEVGRRVLAHTTAVGKAILAELPEPEVRDLVKATGMPALTENTVTSVDALMTNLEGVRGRGYALDEGEQEVGVRCIAIPLPHAPARAGISISGPAGRMTEAMIERSIPQMRAAAERLTAALRPDARATR